ncbi:dipeptidyl peptidase 9-like [Tubulanus polymorphus]|uniref:dipeptidyl peptidase 9-like n=1 Tax=Tubulanus polymorphus TaxID=672921 RepID=UPI003DA5B777
MASDIVDEPFTDLMETNSKTSAPPLAKPRTTLSTQQNGWRQTCEMVKLASKSQYQISNSLKQVPYQFTFRMSYAETSTRLYLLGVADNSRETTLMYVDIPPTTPDSSEPLRLSPWIPLLDAFHAKLELSKEEQLLRERKRMSHFGITSYDLDLDSGQFVFPASASLYTFTDCSELGFMSTKPILPTEVKSTETSGPRMDPKLCPSMPTLIAFVNEEDVWVTNHLTGLETKLTNSDDEAGLVVSAGVPSFVVQEEFDRYTGYWWQPPTDNTYRILYECVDETDVMVIQTMSSSTSACGFDEYRYPRAGTTNAESVLRIVEFNLNEESQVVNVIEKRLRVELKTRLPSMEYLVRAGWTPDGKYVWAQLLDRAQKSLTLVLIPLTSFVATETVVPSSRQQQQQQQCEAEPIYIVKRETSDIWINVHDIFHVLSIGNDNEISFLWISEQTGYRHLYRVTSKLIAWEQQQQRYPVSMETDSATADDDKVDDSVIEEVALTTGDWEVIGKQIWVDEQRNLVYFIGLKDSPLETHLYVTSYDKPGLIQRLTQIGFSHSCSMNQDCTMFVSVYSSITSSPQSHIYRVEHLGRSQIISQVVACLLEPPGGNQEYVGPELFDYMSKAGHKAYGMIYKPHNYIPGHRYPTVLYVYGGPQVQLVTNAYKGARFLRLHTMASLGYVVVVVDSRGSINRGLQFESVINRKMGQVEIEDQVEGLQWIASQVNYIDLSRVAIHGWSYGGYLSLMGLVQRPDVFKVAIAGAPVTSWGLYDTGYTERYMSTPHENAEGYKNGSVLNYLNKFPDEENRLLIVHGLIDENVHFQHTNLLITALIKACKPYDLQVYPNERHGIRSLDANAHYETMIMRYLQRHL